jgi:hypothetical protein
MLSFGHGGGQGRLSPNVEQAAEQPVSDFSILVGVFVVAHELRPAVACTQ